MASGQDMLWPLTSATPGSGMALQLPHNVSSFRSESRQSTAVP